MNTQLNYRGALALGLLAFTLIHPTQKLLAQACQDGDKGAKLLKRFDANQNGQLDAEEQKAADASRQELFQRLHGKYDTDQDGKLSESEKAVRRDAMATQRKETITKFDQDSDGRLNPDEKKAAAAARQAKNATAPNKKSGV
jgi:Ca2+-binding EF-hand superfamily protein